MDSLKFVEFIAHALTESLLNSLWQGTLLAVAIIFMLFIFRALNATNRYLILYLALLTLAFLPFIGIFSVVENLDHILFEDSANQFGIAGNDFGNNVNSASIADTFHQTFNISVSSRIPSITIMILWILVIFFMFCRLLKSFIYIRKLRQNLLPLPSEYHHIFERLLKLVNMNRKVSMYTSCEIKMPMVIGQKNPIILIPYKILGNLTEEQLNYVILHELAHVKRWDDWANLIQKTIEAFYFWHPAIFWISKRLNLEREIACDDYVITLSNEPKSYARCLTRLIELDIVASRRMIATGVAWHKKHITKRLRKIIENGRDRSSRLSILAISLAIYVIFQAFSLFANFMPSVALVEPNSELLQTYIQSETAKVSDSTGSQVYKEIAKSKSKDEKQILSNETNGQKAIGSLSKTVKKSQESNHNVHDILLSKTQSSFFDPMKELNKIDEPTKASGYAIALEPSFPSNHELKLYDDKQAENPKKADKLSSSLAQVLSEKRKQARNGTGEFISEVGKSTSESFSELGNILDSEAKEIKLGTISNFSNMKQAYKKINQTAAEKLNRISKSVKKIASL